MSFREAMPPPNHPPGALPLDPADGLPFPCAPYLQILATLLSLVSSFLTRGVYCFVFNEFAFTVYFAKNVASIIFPFSSCLQCFDAVGWAAGRASGL